MTDTVRLTFCFLTKWHKLKIFLKMDYYYKLNSYICSQN